MSPASLAPQGPTASCPVSLAPSSPLPGADTCLPCPGGTYCQKAPPWSPSPAPRVTNAPQTHLGTEDIVMTPMDGALRVQCRRDHCLLSFALSWDSPVNSKTTVPSQASSPPVK